MELTKLNLWYVTPRKIRGLGGLICLIITDLIVFLLSKRFDISSKELFKYHDLLYIS